MRSFENPTLQKYKNTRTQIKKHKLQKYELRTAHCTAVRYTVLHSIAVQWRKMHLRRVERWSLCRAPANIGPRIFSPNLAFHPHTRILSCQTHQMPVNNWHKIFRFLLPVNPTPKFCHAMPVNCHFSPQQNMPRQTSF